MSSAGERIAIVQTELKAAGIEEKSLTSHVAVLTSEDLEVALKAANTKGHIAKNLLMKDKKKKLYLLVVDHHRKLDLKKVAKQLKVGGNALRFEPKLDILGVEQGSVTPLGVINDTDNKVIVVLDQSFAVAEGKAIVLVHPLTNEATIGLTYNDLKKFVEGQGNTVIECDFDKALPVAAPKGKGGKQIKPQKKKQARTKKGKAIVEDGVDAKGITVKKAGDFAAWYQQIVTRSGLIEYYNISGCYILRPWSYHIWEIIHQMFDQAIKQLDVEPCYFPLFVSKSALEAEADHIEGFAAEVAWVTKSGQSELEEPIAVRPTSETIMYPYFAKWINSHRDLPLKLNQWSNVVRWEFKHPTPFIRSREFLWQEGHSAFATMDEAQTEVLQILDLYASVYQDLLAVPVVKGKKTEEEKFAGGFYTTTVEAFIPQVGRGIQAATSHCLGDNFAKMFDITFTNEKKEKQHVIQNSWGLTTRTIGVMVMVHGDDKGLVLPPRVAPIQIIIIPIIFKGKEGAVLDYVKEIEQRLKKQGVRVKADIRDNYNPGWKFNQYELQGVPLRLEVGPRDVANKTVTGMRRDQTDKFTVPVDSKMEEVLVQHLETMQVDMLARATAERDARTSKVTTFDEFCAALNKRNMVLAPWCGVKACELNIKTASGEAAANVENTKASADTAGEDGEEFELLTGKAKSLCTPFDQPELEEGCTCVYCDKPAINWTLFGRSY